MSLFRTTAEQKVMLYQIASKMKASGLSDQFIAGAVKLGEIYEGAFDLFKLWDEEEDAGEQDKIIADIQHEIEDWEDMPTEPQKKPYVSFAHLDDIGKDVRTFKDKLRAKIDKWGGISKLAKATGIPQPSLSKMLSSNSMPRRTTLYKIADAMGISETEIVTEWLA